MHFRQIPSAQNDLEKNIADLVASYLQSATKLVAIQSFEAKRITQTSQEATMTPPAKTRQQAACACAYGVGGKPGNGLETFMKHFRTSNFYGAGEFAGVHRRVSCDIHGNGTLWTELSDDLASNYALDADALALIEAYWGGEYGDENGAELVVYEGRLIGCFGRKLTDAEFATLQAIPHFGDVTKTTDAERAGPAFKIAAE